MKLFTREKFADIEVKRTTFFRISVLLVIIAITIVAFSRLDRRENLYSGDNYSIMLPQGWAIDSEGNEVSLIFSEEIIATITVEEDFEYGQDIESIVANWIGMRSSILSEDSIETTNKETVFYKTIVGWEQSAAEEMSGESPYPDETHYFYISEDNLFIDIFLRNEEYVEDIENIVKSFHR